MKETNKMGGGGSFSRRGEGGPGAQRSSRRPVPFLLPNNGGWS